MLKMLGIPETRNSRNSEIQKLEIPGIPGHNTN